MVTSDVEISAFSQIEASVSISFVTFYQATKQGRSLNEEGLYLHMAGLKRDTNNFYSVILVFVVHVHSPFIQDAA